MSKKDISGSAADAISAAIARAEGSLATLRKSLAEGDLEELGERAATVASTLYREGQEFIARNQNLDEARSQLRGSIRRSPLAAIGVAFVTGILLAMMSRS
jgi:hypothetical protein